MKDFSKVNSNPDRVICCNCGEEMLVDCDVDVCPVCGKAGCLMNVEEDYQTAGKKVTVDGVTYYSNEYYSFDGLEYGYIYKDGKAFAEDATAVCYIPEHAFDDAEQIVIDGETYFAVEGYTREMLEELIKDYVDVDGDVIDIEYFFDRLVFAFPETYLYEMVS